MILRTPLLMLDFTAVLLIVLWLLGMITGYRFGDAIYLLAIAGIVLIVIRLVTDARASGGRGPDAGGTA